MLIILLCILHVIYVICVMLSKSKKKKLIHRKMSNNSFSSLENISTLIKSLINSNKDALPLKHISKLVDDLTNLLNESDHYDMEIEVGKNDDIKIFKVHSNILKSRSSYFKAVLLDGWIERSENGI